MSRISRFSFFSTDFRMNVEKCAADLDKYIDSVLEYTGAEKENELVRSALRALLRSELMRTHHQAVRVGHASTLDKEVMERTYQSYHMLGGNGIATNLYDEMMALPTIDE